MQNKGWMLALAGPPLPLRQGWVQGEDACWVLTQPLTPPPLQGLMLLNARMHSTGEGAAGANLCLILED